MGFIHGAISPRNVVVLEDGRVKLLDVELAGLRDAREVQELVTTDPPAEYLSPEQIQKGLITEKTDIYAFGVILHELLSGAPPFQGSTRAVIFAKHLKDVPVPVHRRREGIPASVSRAVRGPGSPSGRSSASSSRVRSSPSRSCCSSTSRQAA